MEYLKVSDLTKLFQDGHEGYEYTYYLGRHPLEVYLEYDVTGDAKYIHRYSLTQDDSVWLFLETRPDRLHWCKLVDKPIVEIAGYNRYAAIHFMILKILSKPRLHPSARVDTDALWSILRNTLFEE